MNFRNLLNFVETAGKNGSLSDSCYQPDTTTLDLMLHNTFSNFKNLLLLTLYNDVRILGFSIEYTSR